MRYVDILKKFRSKLKYSLIYFIIFSSLNLQGQILYKNDTIKIIEVIISGNKFTTDPAGYKTTTIDSSTLKNYSQGTLAELLTQNSRIFIKNYGMGGTATPSFRGTGAGHTQIDWNGININSPMLGQSDLALLPAGLIDDIQIYFGGASMALNSGGIGGIINLETRPVWKKETLISISPGIGSFGRYSGLFKVKSGNTNFQSVSKVFLQTSENNFRYLNTEDNAVPVWETRSNSQVQQKGLVQEVYYRTSKSVASAKIWYESANRNLPASLLSQPVNYGEKQFDESFRTLLNYDFLGLKTDYFLTGALLFNRLNYSNRLASIDSRNLSETYIVKTGLDNRIGEHTKLKIVLNEEISVIKSNNYSIKTSRNTSFLTVSVENKGDGRFSSQILVRETFDNNTLLVPDFSTGVQYRIIEDKKCFLKGSVSRNSKIPSMNDMYWMPGGNPDLKNEYAIMYEFTYEMNQKILTLLNLSYDLSFFSNSIKDMIQWHPGEFSYWTADNIQSVTSSGLESSVSLDYEFNKLKAKLSGGYSYTQAIGGESKTKNDASAGKQLIYIPKNQANTLINLSYKNLYSSWMACFTGKRYITSDNTKYLPGYMVNSINTGINLPFKGVSLNINLNIENVFNVNYQSIASYPLPGRSFFFKILVQLFK